MRCPSSYPRSTHGALAVVALCLMTLLVPISASAAERVGHVLIVSGEVTAEREGAAVRSLSRQDPVHAQDTIATGGDGRIQIQFNDGGMVDLQPDTRFRIAEYELDDDGGGSVIMEFLRGALRTVTGSIGENEDDEYRMDTPVATIGIRGTAYALHYCDAACAEGDGELGLYGRVDNGGISVGNDSDTVTFEAGQFFFVPEDGAPRAIVAPPAGILDRNGNAGEGGEDDDTVPPRGSMLRPEAGVDASLTDDDDNLLEPQFEANETTDLRPGETGNVVFGGAFVSGDAHGSAMLLSPDEGDVRLLDGAVVGAEFPSGFVDASETTLEVQDTTEIGSLSIPWGRWDGTVRVGSDVATGGMAFAYTDAANLSPSSALTNPIVEGEPTPVTYNTSINGPAAIGSDGGQWNLTDFSLDADFDTERATLDAFTVESGTQLALDNAPDNSPSGPINKANSSLSIDGMELNSGDWTGTLEGRFVGNNAEALIIKYDLDETSGGNSIQGVAIIQ